MGVLSYGMLLRTCDGISCTDLGYRATHTSGNEVGYGVRIRYEIPRTELGHGGMYLIRNSVGGTRRRGGLCRTHLRTSYGMCGTDLRRDCCTELWRIEETRRAAMRASARRAE
eukprot:3308829-Rhodomonas_salina.1